MGYDVYVSNRIPYRNDGIRKFVWETNPYIKGFSDKEPNCGETFVYKQKHAGYMGNWQIAHGITPVVRYPLVYYTPKKDKQAVDRILLDVTCTSLKDDYNPEQIKEYLDKNYKKEEILLTCFDDGISISMLLLEGYDMIFVKDLFHYSDLINSCKKYVCLFTGGMVLASALQKKQTDCLCVDNPKMRVTEYSSHYFFDNINYIWL